ncbi:hypothetical protein QQX98_001444 [Neonectria punicea]|uniref:Uncharacterized protein n=1 Tax=Neonectria punicea TaxID=979145 RepID=A0ABR1HQ29_9HYPO
MPFDFKAYDEKCNALTAEELQREWEHYTRLISGAATSTAISGIAVPFTLGISTIGVAMAAPAIHNARKKREIIEKHLNKLHETHNTRKRDVLGSMAISGTIGVVTLGVGSMGADAVATAGAEHGIAAVVENETAIKIVTHAALDGAGLAVEKVHTDHKKKKDAFTAFKKAGVFNAVQDAKAAEAGYSIQPYPNQAYHYPPGNSSHQALPMPPPPPYSAAMEQTPGQPAYAPNPNGYPQDFKAPMAYTPVPQGQPYMTPNATGQQPVPRYYGYSTQQGYPPQEQNLPQQQVPPPVNASMAPVNNQAFSPPQTPSPYVMQTQEGVQSPMTTQPQQYQQQPPPPPPTQTSPMSAIPSYNSAASPQTWSMTTMSEALPAQTPTETTPWQQQQPHQFSNSALPTPPQQTTQGYSYPPEKTNFRSQATQATPTGYPPPVSRTPQPPPATQAPPAQPQINTQSHAVSHNTTQVPEGHAVQHLTEPQQPATQGLQPQYHQNPAYISQQRSGPHQQAQVPPPPPPPTDPSRRASVISHSQQSFSPQQSFSTQQSSTPQQQAPVPQQHTGSHQQTYFPPPPPPPTGPSRRASAIISPQQSFAPQQYSAPQQQPAPQQFAPTPQQYTPAPQQTPVPQQHTPVSQQYAPTPQYQQSYTQAIYSPTSTPAQTPQAAQTQVQYQVPPPSQPQIGTSGTQYQQYNTGAYYSVPPPPSQPQKQVEAGAPWQNGQPVYQPQHGFQYPPTPVSLPNSPPMGQNSNRMSYFPPPPTGV